MNGKHIALACLLAVLIAIPSASAANSCDDCWFYVSDANAASLRNVCTSGAYTPAKELVPSPSMDVVFTSAAVTVDGLETETYAVKLGTSMSIENIGGVKRKRAGETSLKWVRDDNVSVRLIELRAEAAEPTESGGLPACQYSVTSTGSTNLAVFCSGGDTRLKCNASSPISSNGCQCTFSSAQSRTCKVDCLKVYHDTNFSLACKDPAVTALTAANEVEVAGNYQPVTHLPDSKYPVCRPGGGTRVIRGVSDSFDAYTFALPGTYRFRLEYARTIDGNIWGTFREFTVVAGLGAVEIIPPDLNNVGVRNSVYGIEPMDVPPITWRIRNTSEDLNVIITGVDDLECQRSGSILVDTCVFPQFPSTGVLLKPGTDYFLFERFHAYNPPRSPYPQRLSINVRYLNPYTAEEVDSATGKVPVDVDVSYDVQAQSVAPYTLSAQFPAEAGKEYFLQVCTDSPENPLFGQAGITASVYDPDNVGVLGMVPFQTYAKSCPAIGTDVFCDGSDTRISCEAVGGGVDVVLSDPNGCRVEPHGAGTPPDAGCTLTCGASGIEVAGDVDSATYSAVSSCTSASSLSAANKEGALMSFIAAETGNYTIRASGNVGYEPQSGGQAGANPSAGDYYGSDFIRIGTSFNAAAQTIPDANRAIPDSALGPQHVVASPPVSGGGTLNVFDRTKELGVHELAVGPSDGAAESVFTLSNISITPSRFPAVQGPVTEYFDGNTAVFVRNDSGRAVVSARTDYLEAAPGPQYPYSDFNLLWVDTEKYMFEVKGSVAGLCRDLQGDATGLSGPAVRPKVKYDWRPTSISSIECDSSNANYSVCDSMQFTIEVLKKLEEADSLAAAGRLSEANERFAPFTAYLMRDGFSADFLADFDAHFGDLFFSVEDADLRYTSKWQKYFSDSARFSFTVGGDAALGGGIHDAGLYEVIITPDFPQGNFLRFFDVQGAPTATLKVDIRKIGSVQPNLLYYLPVDGALGVPSGSQPGSSGTRQHRIGYGVGFTGANIQWFALEGAPTASVWTPNMDPASQPVAVIDVELLDNFVQTTVDSAGRLLSISRSAESPETYSLKFYKATPVPAIFEAQNNGSATVASYTISKSGAGTVNFGTYSSRLTEIGYRSKGQGAMQCTDPQMGLSLPGISQAENTDVQKRDPWCGLKSAAGLDVYGFRRLSSIDANIYLETVFYPPNDGSTYQISNACSAQGRIFLATMGDNGHVSGFVKIGGNDLSQPFSRPQGGITTIAGALAGVSSSSVCIDSSGGTGIPQGVGFWWNEEQFLGELRGRVNSTVPVDACFTQ